jgi:ubiquinone/menaquinone biosynthesis C-methylase UbiE
MHKTFLVARNNRLFNAPVHIGPGYKCNILDLGCGTGIWSIEVAELVPSPSRQLRIS